MPARVNLNVPPRLIESARAAQYANREALDGRALTEKIRAKVQARRAAVLRQQPGGAPDRGDDPPPARDPLKWRIWRKRRPRKPVDVGVGWLHIGYNYTVLPETGPYSDSGWSNGSPPSDSLNFDSSFTRTTRIIEYARTESASLEFVITVGTGSGETWKQARHGLSFVGTLNFFSEWTYYQYDGFGFPEVRDKIRRVTSNSHNFSGRLWYQMFPAGPSEIILVVTIAQFGRSGAFYNDGEVDDDPRVGGNPTSSSGNFTVQSTKQISFLITQSSVTELTHAIPAFMQKKINSVLALPVYQWPIFDIDEPDIGIQSALPQSAIGIHQIGFERASSVVYESIAPDGTFSAVSAQQAKTSYAAYSGIAEIPVLGYKVERDPVVISTPTTERGVFGIIPNASVTLPVTAEMLAAGLDDELEQAPGPNAANQPEPVRMVVAYDYHGGTYCRDRLTQMGINL
jgi:hypothetical protein